MIQVGQCPQCRASNSYEVAQCLDCRQPLPWAGTVQKYVTNMTAARDAVHQLQAQVQQLQQAPQMPHVPFNGVPVPVPPPAPSFNEEHPSGNRFREFAAAFVGNGGAALFEEMGEDRARIAAVLMAGFWNLCVLVGTWLILRNLASLMGAFLPMFPASAAVKQGGLSLTAVIKLLALASIIWGVLFGLCALARKVASAGEGSLAGDLFVAGVTLLPAGLFWVLTGVVGLGNYDFVGVLWVFALCYCALMLYRGLTTVSGVRHAVAALCVPLMFLLDGFALKVIVTRLLSA